MKLPGAKLAKEYSGLSVNQCWEYATSSIGYSI
jgi:hypothetical protein